MAGVAGENEPMVGPFDTQAEARQAADERSTFNFVVFNESDIRVVGRNGETLKPSAAMQEQPKDQPRYSHAASPPRLGHDSYVTAAAAAEILAGKEPDLATYDSLAKALGAKQTGQETIDRARKLAASKIAKAAQAALDSPDPMDAILILGKQIEMDDLLKVARSGARKGAALHAELSEAGQRAKDARRKALLASVRGEDLQALVVDTGIDPLGTLLNIDPARFAEEPGQDADKPARTGQGEPDAEAPIDPMTGELAVTPEELAERTRRMQNLLQIAKDWWNQERARREKAAQDRAARRAAKEAEGEAEGDQDDEDAEAEQDEGRTIMSIPLALLESANVDLTNSREFAHLIRVWIADYLLRRSRGRLTPATLWDDAEAQEKYRKTVIQQLTQMANATVDPIDRALPTINRMIGELNGSMTPDQIERQSAAILKVINSNAIRQNRAKQIDELDKAVKGFLKDIKSADPVKGDVRRKVVAEFAKITKKLPRIAKYTDRKIAAETERLTAIIEARVQAVDDSDNPDQDVSLDVQWHAANLELQMIQRYGGLRYRMPSEIAEATREITRDWLSPERDRLVGIVTRVMEQDTPHVEALLAAIRRDEEQHGRPDREGFGAQLADSIISTVRQRLQNLVKYSKGDDRAAADAAIEHVTLLLGQGSETYTVTMDGYRALMDDILMDVSEGKPDAFLKRLEERIPEDVARQISKQGNWRMTYGQAMQLYASITQASYADNVVRHGRQGQAELIESILDGQQMAFIHALRAMYAARRASLSEAQERVMGVPLWSPDPNYMPVAIQHDPMSGLTAEGRAWRAWAVQLSPRVAHRKDFDETASILHMVSRSNEIAARAIAFGERGIHLRNILGNRDVKKAIIRFHGQPALTRIMDQLKDHLMGIDEKRNRTNDLARLASRLTTYSAISWNVQSMLKQVGSLPTWGLVLEGGFGDMWKALADFDRASMRELVDSDGFRARYGGHMVIEMQEALLAGTGKGSLLKRLYRAGMQPLQAADAVASLAVGTGVYKAKRAALVDQGMDPAQAAHIAKTLTWNLVEECQQSSRPENLPAPIRQWGSIGRLLFQFGSAPMLQASHEIQAARDAMAGVEGAGKKLARVLVINHLIVPTIMRTIQAAWNALLGDDEEEFLYELLADMVIGPMGRLLFLGAATESGLLALIRGRKGWYGSRMLPAESLLRLVESGAVSIHDLVTGDWEEFRKHLLDMISQTGSPQRNVIKWWKNRNH